MRFRNFSLRLLWVGLWVGLCPNAWSASTGFKDAFRAYLDMRRLEEEHSLFSLRTDLEAGVHQSELGAISARLTQARIDFHAILPAERSSLSPWEQRVLERVSAKKAAKEKRAEKSEDESALAFLRDYFPQARQLSAFEWSAITELFGLPTQRAFFAQVFQPSGAPERSQGPAQAVVWVNTVTFPILSTAEMEKEKTERKKANDKIRRLGHEVEEITVSPFIRVEDQAEDLQKLLRKRIAKGPFFVVTRGSASALLLRTFDFHPELLSQTEILGWLNVNGQLYGPEPQPASRKPASLAKPTLADRQEMEVKQELSLLRLETLERPIPLGAKFPVWNVLTPDGKTANLRESVVPEGKTFFLEGKNGYPSLEGFLPSP
jgi:hypothetical protein